VNDDVKKRSERMTKEAQAAVAKRGLMQFRADPDVILALYSIATKRKLRISTMLREWVLERLEQERGNAPLNLDITVNKQKVGSISLVAAALSSISHSVQAQRPKKRKSKAG
jgi:hypothetical protein